MHLLYNFLKHDPEYSFIVCLISLACNMHFLYSLKHFYIKRMIYKCLLNIFYKLMHEKKIYVC